jgi:pyruvate/2-oxoglutarate dehydrogenase complex dihydrolipoamide dehydrogenase (E3) component
VTSPDHYAAIVIGSGQGGNPLSQALANSGLRTALIEREHVGGTCINEGCTPTKTMVASGRVAYLARRAGDYGVHTGPIQVSLSVVRQRKRDIVASFRGGNEKRIAETPNLELVRGEGAFTSPNSIQVRLSSGEQRVLTADKFFINAGCRAAKPSIEGLAEVPYLNSTSIMELDAIPEHLVIIGGGYIGLEFGQLFRRFGARVTILQHANQLLRGEDPDIATEVQKILEQDGLEIFLNAKVQRVAKEGPQIKLTFTNAAAPSDSRTIAGSHLLAATGRVPNSDTLNLNAGGVATDARGYIRVNSKLETNVSGIYALGDIKGGPAFTHISYDDFRILRANLLEKGDASTANRMVPYTVFIDPQLGRIGLTEAEARAQNRKIRIAKMPMSHVARALETDESRGLMKAVVDAETNQILGAAILGVDGGEVMSMLEIAMMGKLPYTALYNATFSHPNLSEALNNLFSPANFDSEKTKYAEAGR